MSGEASVVLGDDTLGCEGFEDGSDERMSGCVVWHQFILCSSLVFGFSCSEEEVR